MIQWIRGSHDTHLIGFGTSVDRVDTYIVTTEEANNFAVSVQLAEDPLLHVLEGKEKVSGNKLRVCI